MAEIYRTTDPSVDADWEAWQAYKQRQDSAAATVTDSMARNAAAIAATYPMLQPGVVATLARAGVTADSPLAKASADNAAQSAQKKVKNKSWYHDLFNSTVRGTFGALSYPFQVVQGTLRQEVGNIQKYGVVGSFTEPFKNPNAGIEGVNAQTDVGQIVKQATEDGGLIQKYGVKGAINPLNSIRMAQDANINTGSGFFMQGDVSAGQAQSARDAWTVDGHAATLGRVVAGALPIEPDDHAYDFISGAIDFAVTLGLDPANVAGGEFAKVRNAKRLFAPLSGKKESVFSEANGGLFKMAQTTGAITGDRKAVAADIADAWISSRVGRAVTERIADMTSPTDVRNAFNKKIPIEVAREMADTMTPEGVQSIVKREVIGGNLREKPYTNGFTPWKPGAVSYTVKRALESQRWAQMLPGDKISLSDPTQGLEQLDRILKNANYKTNDAREWTDKFARADSPEMRRRVVFDALGSIESRLKDTKTQKIGVNSLVRDVDQDHYGTVESINKGLRTAQVRYVDRTGNPDAPITRVSVSLDRLIHADSDKFGNAMGQLTKLYRNVADDFRAYNLDDTGREVGVEGLNINGDGVPIATPMLFAQLTNESLPGLSRKDIVEMRRRTTRDPLFRTNIASRFLTSGPYGGLATATRAVGDKWRDFALLRGAYTLRVVGEEQLRLAANGLDSLFSFHPLSAIAWAVGGKTSKSVLGMSDEELDAIRLDAVADAKTRFGKAVAFKTNSPEVQRLKARFARGGQDVWGNDFEQPSSLEDGFNDFSQALLKAHGDKRWAKSTMFEGWIPIARGNERYAESWANNLLQHFMSPETRRLAGGWKEGDDALLTGNDLNDVKEWYWSGGGRKYRQAQAERGGNWSALAEDRALADKHIDALNDSLKRLVQDDPEIKDLVATGRLGGQMATNDQVTEFLARKAEAGVGPNLVRGHPKEFTPEKKGHYRQGVDAAFDLLITKPSNYITRSPAARQFYWERQAELMPSMMPAVQQKVLEEARKANLDGRRMTALEQAAKKGSGDLTRVEADKLAKIFAIDSTKKLLYDLSDKGQFFDMFRIAFPFGEAWKEGMTVWAQAFSNNPTLANRLGQGVQAGRDAGFFYTDENGQEVFNYPLSGQVSQMMTGTFTPLKGQLTGLNMLGNGMPGLGPVMQIAADQIIKNKPSTPDWIKEMVLPAGGPDYENGYVEAFFPGWLKRGLTAVKGEDNRTFANTMGNIARYKVSTGEYNIETPEGMARLEKDSKKSARNMFILRALSQFVAPTAPAPEWMARDKQGHLTTATQLMQAYRDLQNDPNIGYDNADSAFLQLYGDKALLYMQPLSRGGFSPTTELHEFVVHNMGFVERHPEVYGYFAGDGGAFSSAEYERQLANGERETLSAREIYKLANDRVARLQYNQIRELAGPKPNKQALEVLRSVKTKLMQEYPGYNPDGYTVEDRDQKINYIELAIDDKAISDTDTARAAAQYIQLRSYVKQRMPGFATSQSDQAKALRLYLSRQGDAISESNADFSRMWTDLFAPEVKTDD